jgi:hypothetical protein
MIYYKNMTKHILLGGFGIVAIVIVWTLALGLDASSFRHSPIFFTWFLIEELVLEPVGLSDFLYLFAIRSGGVLVPLIYAYSFVVALYFVVGGIIGLLVWRRKNHQTIAYIGIGTIGLIAVFASTIALLSTHHERLLESDAQEQPKDYQFVETALTKESEVFTLTEAVNPVSVKIPVQFPINSTYISFDWYFPEGGDGDYVGIFVQGDQNIWTMDGTIGARSSESFGNPFVDARAVQVGGLSGTHDLLVVLYPVGNQNSSFQIKNIVATQAIPTY